MKLNNEFKILSLVAGSVLIIALIVYFSLSKEKDNKVDTVPELSLSNGITNYSEGPQDAKVTVVEFFDPECETCAQVSPYIKNEMKYYAGKVRWIFRYMAYHPSSNYAIHILEAARNQNLYLESMALLLERQSEWGLKHDGSAPTPKEKELIHIISTLPGINLKKLQEDMKNPEIDKLIENDKKQGTLAGVTGTPTLFVNDKIIDPLNLDTMIERINLGLSN